MANDETFDDAPYQDIELTVNGLGEITVSGLAGGTFRWDGADLPASYEAGGVMMEPAESRFPADIVITSLTEAKAFSVELKSAVELNPEQQAEVVEVLNDNESFLDSVYESIQESSY